MDEEFVNVLESANGEELQEIVAKTVEQVKFHIVVEFSIDCLIGCLFLRCIIF